ncbi:hypothetical protein PGN35_007905 [Nodosilinea sp. PGN35]|uniref:hypothetical protein n=1 Tax=Nodosilinea sp. PGN35 TaxID=3020489 RepID=UPI00398B1608
MKKNKFFSIGSIGWGLLISAALLAIIGAGLAYAPRRLALNQESYWTSLCYNLSSAFLASAVLTLTLEFANNYQRNKDIETAIQKIQTATTDSILKELIGDDSILGEVKTHILKQNLVRKGFRVALNLQWDLDSYRESVLIRKLDSNYSIHNLTSQTITYIFRIIETKENEPNLSKLTKITCASYDIKDSRGQTIESEKYQEQTISVLLEESNDSISLSLGVDIPAECFAELKFTSQSVLKPDVIDPIVSLVATTDMEIDLVFPYNVRANALGIHPDPNKFQLQIDQQNRKRWRANGLLPGQGVLLTLKRVPNKDLPREPLPIQVDSMLKKTQLPESSSQT